MIKEGLGGFEDHPDKILTYAVELYSSADEGFQMKFEQLTQLTGELINKIYVQAPDLNTYLEEFGKEIIESPGVILPVATNDKI